MAAKSTIFHKKSYMSKSQKARHAAAHDISSEIFLHNTSLTSVSLNASLKRTLHWIGGVNGNALSEVVDEIKSMLIEDKLEPIRLIITSYGGPTGIGMSFYDSMRVVYKPQLITVGSGDVDSSGVIILLSGEKRYLTRNTTLFLHH
jgi:ATP-dependent protease ClpP protease subunit